MLRNDFQFILSNTWDFYSDDLTSTQKFELPELRSQARKVVNYAVTLMFT